MELDGYLGHQAKGLKPRGGSKRNTMWESGGPQPDGVPPFLQACTCCFEPTCRECATQYAGLAGYACTSANGESRISAVVLQGAG